MDEVSADMSNIILFLPLGKCFIIYSLKLTKQLEKL